jgi:light-regulated signal transduction histidine kinase (bacteriophytochrome)
MEAARVRGTPFSLELRVLREDGTVRVVHSRGFADRAEDGRPARLYGFVQDITERKRDEEQLKEYRDHLEELVEERTEEIARRSAELEAANAELEAFSYSVSHDLRAPLRRVDGFSRTLSEGYADSVDDRGKHFLERIRANARQMGDLIDDLLKLSRVSRSEMRYERVDLSALVGRIAAELRSTNRDREVRFQVQPDLVALGDPRLLEAAVRNLLANAWKFTSRAECAVIEFGATENAGCEPPDEELGENAVVYFVRDTGAGFDMAYADKLFAPFQRLHRADEFEGSGIGLATVQRIIRRHGGKIWARGAVGSGATFYFNLSPVPEKEKQ